MSQKNNDHSGIAPFAGFMYQWSYFLLKLLQLQKGEIISFEKLDDVGSETNDGIVMYQLKHTIKSSETKASNLTDKDTDLWKAISVWIDIIQKQGDKPKQEKYLSYTDFVFVSNKDYTKSNFIAQIIELQNKRIQITDLCKHLDNELKGWKPSAVTEKDKKKERKTTRFHIYTLRHFLLQEEFLKRLRFKMVSDDGCKNDILYDLEHNKMIFPEKKIQEAYRDYLGSVWDECGAMILAGKPVSYTKEQFSTSFRNTLSKYRGPEYRFQRKINKFNNDPLKETFIQQLLDIGDFTISDRDIIARYISQCYDYLMNMQNMVSEHYVKREDIEQTEEDAFYKWREKFKRLYLELRTTTDNDKVNGIALQLLDEIRQIPLNIADSIPLDNYHSNGCFYHLSNGDSPRIGWHKNWEKYKKNNG